MPVPRALEGGRLASRQSATECRAAWRTVESRSSSALRTAARASGPSMRVSAHTALRRASGETALAMAWPSAVTASAPPSPVGEIARSARPDVDRQGAPRACPRASPASRAPGRADLQARGSASADAIDTAEHIGLGQLRRGATELVPAARVDDEQAAVGVFEHVGRDGSRGCPRRGNLQSCVVNVAPSGVEHMPRDFLQVEQRGEEVVADTRRRNTRDA